MTDTDIKEWSIVEEALLEFIADTELGSDSGLGHKGINQVLKDILEMGHQWRSAFHIVLISAKTGATSEFDTDYQKYLDRKASRLEASYHDENKED